MRAIKSFPFRGLIFGLVVVGPFGAFAGLWHPQTRGTDTYFATSAGIAATLLIADVVALGLLAPVLLAEASNLAWIRDHPVRWIRRWHPVMTWQQRLGVWSALAAGVIYPAFAMLTALAALTHCTPSTGVVYCGKPPDMAAALGGIFSAAGVLLAQVAFVGFVARAPHHAER